ncbi:endonuclease/exonuclease/phosphatase family protein [soil metagenome]
MTRTTLRLVSYNLLHGRDLRQRGAVDLTAVAAVLAAVNADVVALQEVDRAQERSGGADQIGELAALLDMTGVFCPALRGSPDRAWVPAHPDIGGPAYGVGLLSRLTLTDTDRIVLPGGGAGTRSPSASLRNPGWDREPRVALTARVHADRWVLPVTVTHLSYMPWRALRQLRAAAATAPARGVIVGDLNLPAWAVRSALPGWRHAGGAATFPAWQPRLQMHHVLLDGAVEITRAVAHPDTTSDHLPLVVDLRHP